MAKMSVQIRLDHSYIGDLVVTLLPPPGKGLPKAVLHNRAGGNRNSIDKIYDAANTPALAAYAGKACDGRWTVQVDDKAAQDAGTLKEIGLQLTPAPAPAAPTLHIAVTAVPKKKVTRAAKKRARAAA